MKCWETQVRFFEPPRAGFTRPGCDKRRVRFREEKIGVSVSQKRRKSLLEGGLGRSGKNAADDSHRLDLRTLVSLALIQRLFMDLCESGNRELDLFVRECAPMPSDKGLERFQ